MDCRIQPGIQPGLQPGKTELDLRYDHAKRYLDMGDYRSCLSTCEEGLDLVFGVPRFMSIGDRLRELEDQALAALACRGLRIDKSHGSCSNYLE